MRFAACTLMLLVPAVPFADDFSDFRIPANRALLWDARLSTAARDLDASQPGREFSNGVLNGNVLSTFQWFSDADPAFTSALVRFAATGDRRDGRTDSQLFAPTQTMLATDEGTDRSMAEHWELSLSHRRYPWAMPVGFEVAASGFGNYSQRWFSRDFDHLNATPGSTTESILSQANEIWTYQDGVTGSVSAGWGRVRNATGIYDALVLEQRIRATGALTRPLSSAARRRLAELLYARFNLDTVRERPGRSLWGEVERILREDGALGERGFDPFSVLRGEEPFIGESVRLTEDGMPISPVTRLSGGFLGARLIGHHGHIVQRQSFSSSFQTITDGIPAPPSYSSGSGEFSTSDDDVEAGVTGEIHRPLGILWQLNASGLALAGLRAEDNFLIYDTQVALAWLAADRWTATATGRYAGRDDDRTTGATAGDGWLFGADVGVTYYLEDRVAIELTASEQQTWNRGQVDADPSSPAAHGFHRTLGASLALTYRFSGWFQMPGIFPVAGTGAR